MDLKVFIWTLLFCILVFTMIYMIINHFHIVVFIPLFVGVYNVFLRLKRGEPHYEAGLKSGIIAVLTVLVCAFIYKYLIDVYGFDQCQKIATLEFLKNIIK